MQRWQDAYATYTPRETYMRSNRSLNTRSIYTAKAKWAFSVHCDARSALRLLIMAAGPPVVFLPYRKKARATLSPFARRGVLDSPAAAIALCVIITMILGPTLRIPKLKSEETFVAVMVDATKSMTIEDSVKGGTRFDSARKVLMGDGGDAGLAGQLNSEYAVRLFGFGDGAKRVNDPHAIVPDGERTNLFRSIRDVTQELRGVSLASVVMLSDGGNNTPGQPLEMAQYLKSQKIKLYTVGFGSPNPPGRFSEVVRVQQCLRKVRGATWKSRRLTHLPAARATRIRSRCVPGARAKRSLSGRWRAKPQ